MRHPTTSQLLMRPGVRELQQVLVDGGWLPATDDALTPTQLLGTVVADWLSRYGLSFLAISLTLRYAKATIDDVAAALIGLDEKSPLPHELLVIVEERYVACRAEEGFLDLHTGSTIKELPQPAAVTLNLQLAVLYFRTLHSFA